MAGAGVACTATATRVVASALSAKKATKAETRTKGFIGTDDMASSFIGRLTGPVIPPASRRYASSTTVIFNALASSFTGSLRSP